MSNGNIFLLSWDMQGLEACINISDIDKQATWAVLQDQKPNHKLSTIVNGVMLRARYNSQRHYEVYTVTMDSSITVDDVREMFEANPQGMADLIRDRGNKMYSDRIDKTDVKIV